MKVWIAAKEGGGINFLSMRLCSKLVGFVAIVCWVIQEMIVYSATSN